MDAAYYSVVTLTTVGYGDLHPDTTFQKLFAIGLTFVAVSFIAAAVGILLDDFITDALEDDEYEAKAPAAAMGEMVVIVALIVAAGTVPYWYFEGRRSSAFLRAGCGGTSGSGLPRVLSASINRGLQGMWERVSPPACSMSWGGGGAGRDRTVCRQHPPPHTHTADAHTTPPPPMYGWLYGLTSTQPVPSLSLSLSLSPAGVFQSSPRAARPNVATGMYATTRIQAMKWHCGR